MYPTVTGTASPYVFKIWKDGKKAQEDPDLLAGMGNV